MRNQLRVNLPCRDIDVAHIVAELMVARIVPVTSLPTEFAGFAFGFLALCSSCDAASWDT